MPDYQGNSKKDKEAAKVPAKKVERVVVNEVHVQKKGVGRKFRDLFLEANLKAVIGYVAVDVLIPAAKNMLYDAIAQGGKRMIFGESAQRHRGFGVGPRITYNNPINRGYSDSPLRDSPSRYAPAVSREPRVTTYDREDFIISSKEEAELVLERMNDIVDTYEVASVADLHDLVGLPTSHTDNKWGWSRLGDVHIRQVREGYLIELPPAEPIQ